MVCAAGCVKSEGQIVTRERSRGDGRKRIGQTNPSELQAVGHQGQRIETEHRMNPGSTRWTRARVVTVRLVMKTRVRGVAGRWRVSSLPPLQVASYIEDALSDRVICMRRVTTEEMESCIRIAIV